MTHFDDKAASWDDDPDHVKRAKIIAKRLKLALANETIETAMEYGSGTGQLSFELKNVLPRITLMDESINMTKVAMQKCNDLEVDNLYPIKYDLLLNPLFFERYDLIYSMLTLHHIENIRMILEKFNQLMNPGGLLILIDLEKEDGSFHDYEFQGHLGFDRKELEKKLNRVGFSPIHYEICYTIDKEMENGKVRGYPLFLLVSKEHP
jgi:predicted TPR repeat methyltransferase